MGPNVYVKVVPSYVTLAPLLENSAIGAGFHFHIGLVFGTTGDDR